MKTRIVPLVKMIVEKKAKKYAQVFLPKYKDIPGINSSTHGKSYAFCTYCQVDFSISHSGAYDIERHLGRERHKDMVKLAKSHRSIKDFFPKPQLSDLEENVIKAEVMFTEMIVKLNMPFTTSDLITKTVKAAFPDSAIAQKYSCGRSKATTIVKELAKDAKKELVVQMKEGPFSLATDGNNDQKEKQFPVVITTASLDDGVSCRLLSVPVLTGKPATGMWF